MKISDCLRISFAELVKVRRCQSGSEVPLTVAWRQEDQAGRWRRPDGGRLPLRRRSRQDGDLVAALEVRLRGKDQEPPPERAGPLQPGQGDSGFGEGRRAREARGEVQGARNRRYGNEVRWRGRGAGEAPDLPSRPYGVAKSLSQEAARWGWHRMQG